MELKVKFKFLFCRFFYKSSDKRDECSSEECKLDYLCALVTADYDERHCDELKELLNEQRLNDD